MAITPQIRVNNKTPRPDGIEADATFALGASAIPLGLASTTGIDQFAWELVAKPDGATTAIANTAPSSPFATTINVLDKEGTYILRGMANGDLNSIKEVAITVLAAESTDGLRIPARAEKDHWDGAFWWAKSFRDLFLAVAKRRIGVAMVAMPNANYVVPASEYKKRVLYVAGALTASRDLTLPHGQGDPFWLIVNATTGGFQLFVRGPTGAGSYTIGRYVIAVSDGTNFYT